MKNKKKGFTLVELIVVLAILAILAAMLVPALTGYIDKANKEKIVAETRQAVMAAQATVSDDYANNKKVVTNGLDGSSTESSVYFNAAKETEIITLAELTDKGDIVSITISEKGVVKQLVWKNKNDNYCKYDGTSYTLGS